MVKLEFEPLRMSRVLRWRLRGVRRMVGLKEILPNDTQGDLLRLHNRLQVGGQLTAEEVAVIGNASALIMWQGAQLKAAGEMLGGLLGEGES